MKRYRVEKDNKMMTTGTMKAKEIATKYLIPDMETEIKKFGDKYINNNKIIKVNSITLPKIDKEIFMSKCNPFLERDNKITITLILEDNYGYSEKTIIYTISIL